MIGCHTVLLAPNLDSVRSMLYLLSHTGNKTPNPSSVSATLCLQSSRGHGISKDGSIETSQ